MQVIPPPLFVPECYADTALMRTLLRENEANRAYLDKQAVNHQHGIGNVGNIMKEQGSPNTTHRVLGMVDLDREFGQQKYLRQFTRVLDGSIVRGATQHVLLQHPQHPTQLLLVLNPVFEVWLAARAAEVGKTLADYDIPSKSKPFKKYSRIEDRNPNSGLRQLLAAIATARHPAYAALADFVAVVADTTRPLPW